MFLEGVNRSKDSEGDGPAEAKILSDMGTSLQMQGFSMEGSTKIMLEVGLYWTSSLHFASLPIEEQ